MSSAPPSQVTKASVLHAPAFFFFFVGLCSNTGSNYPKSESLLLWHTRSGKCRRNAVRWEERKKKKQEVGTFPSPTRSLMIFVLLSFNSYLTSQPFTARSARTDLCFTKDAQSPFVEDMVPKLWRLGCAALSAGTLSILLVQLCRQCFRTKIILPICLNSILYNLLCTSAIHTVNYNKSMWTRLEPQILGPFVICGSWTLVCSCTFDLLHAHIVPWALAMKSKYCLFPIKNTQMVGFFPPSSYFKGVIQKLKPWPYQWEWDTKLPFVISFSNTKQSHET